MKLKTTKYEQARPKAALALRRIAQWTTKAIHHHLGDCSWVTLPGCSADLVCIVMHLHAHIRIATPTPCQKYCLVMSFLSQYASAKAKQAFCPIAYFLIERGPSAA